MSYPEFSLEQVVREFNLNYQEDERIFTEIERVEPSDWLRETLNFNLPLAIAIGSEKARSEMLIAPIATAKAIRTKPNAETLTSQSFPFCIRALCPLPFAI